MAAMRAWREWWDEVHEEQTQFIDALPERRLRGAVVLASAAALFLEMVMVRWHGTCFHAFAIFKNVSLLSCFLGLGIGFGLSQRRTLGLAAVLPLLALQTFLFGALSCTNLGGRRVNPIGEQLIMGTGGDAWSWIDAVEGNFFLGVVFIRGHAECHPKDSLAMAFHQAAKCFAVARLNLGHSHPVVGFHFEY